MGGWCVVCTHPSRCCGLLQVLGWWMDSTPRSKQSNREAGPLGWWPLLPTEKQLGGGGWPWEWYKAFVLKDIFVCRNKCFEFTCHFGLKGFFEVTHPPLVSLPIISSSYQGVGVLYAHTQADVADCSRYLDGGWTPHQDRSRATERLDHWDGGHCCQRKNSWEGGAGLENDIKHLLQCGNKIALALAAAIAAGYFLFGESIMVRTTVFSWLNKPAIPGNVTAQQKSWLSNDTGQSPKASVEQNGWLKGSSQASAQTTAAGLTPTITGEPRPTAETSLETSCVRRIAAAFRGQAMRYGATNQKMASNSHLRSINLFRQAGFDVDVFLATRSSATQRELENLYKPIKIAVVRDSDCRLKHRVRQRLCYQAIAMAKIVDLILETKVSYSYVLIARFDERFKIDLLSTPGLVQSHFARCSSLSALNHTYFGPFRDGSIDGPTYVLWHPGTDKISDYLQLFPAHVLPCVKAWFKKNPGRHRMQEWIPHCDPDAVEGVLLPGWYDEGIKGQSNPLYDMPGRENTGLCTKQSEFRWHVTLATSRCTKSKDSVVCKDVGSCNHLCPSKCRRMCIPDRPVWKCCGNGSATTLPLNDPGNLLPGLPVDWWQVRHSRWCDFIFWYFVFAFVRILPKHQYGFESFLRRRNPEGSNNLYSRLPSWSLQKLLRGSEDCPHAASWDSNLVAWSGGLAWCALRLLGNSADSFADSAAKIPKTGWITAVSEWI